jgi:paraquat-inducible protein B
MSTRPAVVGGFILGALALGVAAILLFGSVRLFSRTTRVVAFFDEAVAGLDVGAPVTFHGVPIGSVHSISIQFATSAHSVSARIPVILDIHPTQVSWEGKRLTGSVEDVEHLVKAGLRARLELQSLVTGQLYVDLDFRPDTPPELVGAMRRLPEIPTAPSTMGEIRQKLASLPLREVVEGMQSTLASLKTLSDHFDARLDPLVDSVQRTADSATKTFQTADALLDRTSGHLDARANELSQTLIEVRRTAQQANVLLSSLNEITDQRSSLRDNLEATARDLADSASSLSDFAKTVEEHPNAIILGRKGR